MRPRLEQGSPACSAESPRALRYRCPPDAEMRSPVSHDDWSEARNSATRAMSSGWPILPIGMTMPIAFAASIVSPIVFRPSVSVVPGAIALTRIFFGASSTASARVMVSTAAFEAE